MMRYLSLFFSDAATDWLGAPTPFRWCVRVVVLGALLFLFYHLFTGSL